MLTLTQIMSLRTNILSESKVKLVRHKDNRVEYKELIKDRDELLKYQKEQSKHVFKDCDYICSFSGLEGSRSVFIGLFKVNSVTKKEKYHYELEEVTGFEDLKDRLVIDWGKATISWHQWVDENKDKLVLEIMPNGYLGEFPGLLEFTLDFSELEILIRNPEANRNWYHHLSSVNGIYLILDTTSGKQYIGSAYGQDGVWQRWAEYVTSRHGGNKYLKELCDKTKNHHENFRFSVLQSLPSNISNKEVIALENLYKNKLGSRSFGLNAN